MQPRVCPQPILTPHDGRLSERAARASEQPISFLMHAAVANPDLISLAAGLVDPQSLPAELASDTIRELLSNPSAAQPALQYGTTQGYSRLRELLAEHLTRLDPVAANNNLRPDEIVLTTGSQQMLQLVSETLVDPGDIVLVGAPDYFVYLGTLAGLGARAIAVPMDERGIVPEALVDTLSHLDRAGELSRVKLLYCVSYYQNPTGVTLAAERRPAILEIIEKWSQAERIFILEDAAYRELAFREPAPPSLRSYDEHGERVILAQTFSKSLSPGMKLGYTVLPRQLLAPVLHLKGNHDFGSPNFIQHVMAGLLESGRYQAHVKTLRSLYHRKCNAALEAIAREFTRHGVPVHETRPQGGMYIWLSLPADLDTSRESMLFKRCLERGVLYVPGEYCFPPGAIEAIGSLGGPRNTMRLSFGVSSEERLGEGIRRLAAAAAESA